MSEAIKPTPGPLEASRNDEAVCGKWSIRVPGQHPVVSYEIAEITGYRIDGSDEIDARLMAEAGTVAHETGLTPRQLVERVKELEEVVRELVAYDESDHEDSVGMMLDYSDMLKAARKAISKSLPNTVAEVK